MTRVVSITSMAVERDSRTYKFAASIARLGYESIVVEGEPSARLAHEPPFELISPRETLDEQVPNPRLPGPTPFARLVARLPRPFAGAVHLLTYPIDRWIVIPLRAAIFTLRLGLHDYRRRNSVIEPLLPTADVYWLRSFFQVPSVSSKARESGARFLYDTPDAYWEPPGLTPAATRSHRLVLRYLEAMEKRAVRRAERFTTVSEGLAGLLERRFGKRPEVIRNCHDLRLDQQPPRDLRAVTEVSADDFLLVMTGNRKAGLTFREALEAMRMLPERIHIAFVGRGHEQSRPLVEAMGLSDRVHLPSPVPPTQVVSFIRTADASPILLRALTPSYRYSLPNGFFHAIAAGLPVIFPALPEMSAVATEYQLGVEMDPTDPDSIAEAIRSLYDDRERVSRYRANVEDASRVINWEHEERLIAEILGGSAAPVKEGAATATLPR